MAEPEEDENSGDAEPEKAAADESVAEAEESEGAQEAEHASSSVSVVDPAAGLGGRSVKRVLRFLGTQSSNRSFAGEDSLLPSLWSTSCGTYSVANKIRPVSRTGAQVIQLPQLHGRLSPILLMQLKYIGQNLLQENTRRCGTSESRGRWN